MFEQYCGNCEQMTDWQVDPGFDFCTRCGLAEGEKPAPIP